MLLRKPLRLLLIACRLVLHRLPASVRLKLRHQHRLLGLYKDALHASHLFYGTLPKAKLNKRYQAILSWQQNMIDAAQHDHKQYLALNCLILSNNDEACTSTIDSLVSQPSIQTVYVLSGNSGNSNSNSQAGKPEQVRYITSAAQIPNDIPLLLLRCGERLRAGASSMFLKHVSNDSQILTCDTDFIVAHNEYPEAECYPSWDPDLQLACGYLKTGICINDKRLLTKLQKTLAIDCEDNAFALWLAGLAFDCPDVTFTHLPLTLVHRREEQIPDWQAQLAKYATTKDWPIKIAKGKSQENVVIQWRVPTTPLVSIIIPTRNAKVLVEQCIESILTKSTYSNFEILLIDNQSDESESLDYFARLPARDERIRILEYPHEFNYSAINNFAVRQAQGELLAFVNNDIEVISADWLASMVAHAVRQDVGCVGARLLYPNRRIQHAGVVLGYGGGAGHAHKYFPDYHSGYLNRLFSTHSYSAVTAACLVVSKAIFCEVDGFNEQALPVAFNDVDLCLKIRALGYRNIYCAEAELFHHESVSRGDDNTPEKRTRFERELTYLQAQWASIIENDPAYNPNLTLRQENFALTELPRV